MTNEFCSHFRDVASPTDNYCQKSTVFCLLSSNHENGLRVLENWQRYFCHFIYSYSTIFEYETEKLQTEWDLKHDIIFFWQ